MNQNKNKLFELSLGIGTLNGGAGSVGMHTKEHLDTKNPSGFACDTEFAMMMRSLRDEHHLSFAFKHEKG